MAAPSLGQISSKYKIGESFYNEPHKNDLSARQTMSVIERLLWQMRVDCLDLYCAYALGSTTSMGKCCGSLIVSFAITRLSRVIGGSWGRALGEVNVLNPSTRVTPGPNTPMFQNY